MKTAKLMRAAEISICWIILSALIISHLPLHSVFAEGTDGSLTVVYENDTAPVVGAGFSIYMIAASDENGELAVCEAFSKYSVSITDSTDDLLSLASTLEGYVLRDSLTPDRTGTTDEDGKIAFDNLARGLYLVLGERHVQDGYVYSVKPYTVMLPSYDAESDEWIYSVTSFPKKEVAALPDEGETVSLKVLKVWSDSGEGRPQNVEISLLCDGEVYDTVILGESDNWRYTWDGLDADHRWNVVETPVENYTVEITREGSAFVVKNTADAPPSADTGDTDDRLPQTGQLWWLVSLLVCGGLVFVLIGATLRRGARNEK